MKTERKNQRNKGMLARSSKECAYLAVFVALVIGGQVCFAAIPGVEIVTLLFVSYAFAFGICRGCIAATAFSLLRQLIFGFFPSVLFLYIIYYNLLAVVFGGIGKAVKNPLKNLWWITVTACVCTACFTAIDTLINYFWLGLSKRAFKAYVYASFSVAIPQIVCTAMTVAILFYPLQKIFRQAKKGLNELSN